ncbi:phosphoprotein phosphatase [Pisolithus marmoratus]|nr:phosphoprotein phosphatase [Pisolithus marmoratus]
MSVSSSESASMPTTTASSSPEIQSLSIRDVADEDRELAKKIKAEANKAFAGHNFTAAVKLYSEAIQLNPTDATFWCNRAAARTKLEEHGFALADSSKAIDIDPKYAKAYYRRATCYLQLAKPQMAVLDLKKVLALEPRNDTVRGTIEFEKAIEMEEEKNAVERCLEIIGEGNCDVERDYTGPKMQKSEDGKYTITQGFITQMIDWFKQGKKITRRFAWEIILGAYAHFSKEESLVQINLDEGETCDVIGDVHGQFYDLLHLYSLTGAPKADHYLLMNGDLVDRGSWSIEVILIAFAYKWLYPNRMFINRGNHEAKEMNRTYGFEGEAKHKHGEQTYKLFAHVFTAMPLATLVSATRKPRNVDSKTILSPEGFKRYFVVHGGLFSKDNVTLDDVRKIPRIGRQPGQEGLMCELLWTDPQESPGRGPSKRGVGLSFGPDVTRAWCTLNGVTGIIRSHEVRPDGYAVEHEGLCTTVFSAPNYVDQVGNKGAYIRIDASGDLRYTQFEAQPHPPIKPMAYAMGGLASLMM